MEHERLNEVLFNPHSRVGTNLDSWFAGVDLDC